MRRFHPFLKGLWVLIVLGLAIGLVSNWWAAKSLNPHQVVLTQVMSDFLRTYGPWILLVIVPLALLTLWAGWDERRYRTHFDLLKPAKKLRPGDLRFQELEPTDQPAPEKRPYYSTYIPRVAVAHDREKGASYTEEALAQALLQGQSFVLLGEPLAGKTRTLYEIVRRMEEYRVIRPKRDAPVPLEDDFSPLKGRKVILLLDDLNDYVRYDLPGFRDRLDQCAACTVVAATCRDGAELEAVRTDLRRFYTGISLKLKLRSLTAEEKQRLAQGIDKDLDPQGNYPTPGSITMERSMDDMHERFLDLPPEQQDILRSLRLLSAGGVYPYTHRRLDAVLERVFHRAIGRLDDLLDILERRAFLYPPGHSDPVRPEPAYLRDAVTNTGHERSEDDFAALAGVLVGLKDAEGLLYLGANAGNLWRDYERALACFEEVVRLGEKDSIAWYGKGRTLSNLGRHAEAVAAYERVTELVPDAADAWVDLGRALHDSGRYTEALTAYERAISIQPDHTSVWFCKGGALRRLGRHQEALIAYERDVELDPASSSSWNNLGNTLDDLGRYREALAAQERALELDPDDAVPWYNKGNVLGHLGDPYKSLAAYERALELDPSYRVAWINKGHKLYDLRRYVEALSALQRAIDLDPNDAGVWGDRGRTLRALHRPLDALDAYERGLRIDPHHVGIWNNKGVALEDLDRLQEAFAAFEHAIQLDPHTIHAWTNKVAILRRLGRTEEAAVAERCRHIVRYVEEVWDRKDMDAIEAFVAPDCAYHDPTVFEGDACGIDGVVRLVTTYHTAFPDLHIKIEGLIGEGDKVAARWTMRGTQQGELRVMHETDRGKPSVIPPTSKYMTVTGAATYHIADAKIAEVWHYWDRSDLLQQLGVMLCQPRRIPKMGQSTRAN